jgi:glutathione peroxidase
MQLSPSPAGWHAYVKCVRAASPLFEFLKKEQGGILTSDVKWNFSKFLIDREGNVVGRWFSTVAPVQLEKEILKYL